MYQQVNLTLMSQWCSGKVVSSYSVLRGFDSQCGSSKVFKHHFILFLSYDNVFFLYILIFDNLLYACFLLNEILFNAIKCNAVHFVSLTVRFCRY